MVDRIFSSFSCRVHKLNTYWWIDDMYTLMTKEYRTVSSMLLMFKWRISKDNFSKTLIILTIWPGILLEIVLRRTFDPEIFASTSATGELQHAPSSLKLLSWIPKGLSGSWGLGWNCLGLGPGLGLRLFLRFLASKDCKTWCNSLMNSITPPIIDAWSPFTIKKIQGIRERYCDDQFVQKS